MLYILSAIMTIATRFDAMSSSSSSSSTLKVNNLPQARQVYPVGILPTSSILLLPIIYPLVTH